jgi:hypothetical protein
VAAEARGAQRQRIEVAAVDAVLQVPLAERCSSGAAAHIEQGRRRRQQQPPVASDSVHRTRNAAC